MIDHPVIQNMERFGTPNGKAETPPICPVCGEACSTIYMHLFTAIGCDECVDKIDAWDFMAHKKER